MSCALPLTLADSPVARRPRFADRPLLCLVLPQCHVSRSRARHHQRTRDVCSSRETHDALPPEQVQHHQQEVPECVPDAVDHDRRLPVCRHSVGLPPLGIGHPEGPQGAHTLPESCHTRAPTVAALLTCSFSAVAPQIGLDGWKVLLPIGAAHALGHVCVSRSNPPLGADRARTLVSLTRRYM